MKKLIIIFLFTPFISKSQECPRYDKTISLSGGVPMNMNFEVGIQGDLFGVSSGIKSYVVTTLNPHAQVKQTVTVNLSPFVKVDVSVLSGEDNSFRLYFLAYGGYRIYGAGFKIGYIANDELMIFSENSYGESKLQLNGGIAFRL
jgi:hypothetical protein